MVNLKTIINGQYDSNLIIESLLYMIKRSKWFNQIISKRQRWKSTRI